MCIRDRCLPPGLSSPPPLDLAGRQLLRDDGRRRHRLVRLGQEGHPARDRLHARARRAVLVSGENAVHASQLSTQRPQAVALPDHRERAPAQASDPSFTPPAQQLRGLRQLQQLPEGW
eukprot:382155-Hanusia_phi.AAC.1